jgi:hypothetical protein
MRALADIELAIEAVNGETGAEAGAKALLALSEEVLGHWITARGDVPTDDEREGFRLLALHRQGTKGDPSFNACRETCREIAYHYNLITMRNSDTAITDRLTMMKMISSHLYLFVSGKLQVAGLGEFCCSSRPIRLASGSGSRRWATAPSSSA